MIRLTAFSLLAALVAGSAFAESDVTTMDIQGFRLGMTLEEARKISPTIKISEIKPDGATVIGYKGRVSDMKLLFTSDRLGQELFNIQKLRMYDSKPNPRPIFDGLTKKYGNPDYNGRGMFRIHACWGKCFGRNKRLEFVLKIAGMRAQAFPMTLTLSDPAMGKKNREMYKKGGGGKSY